MEKFGLGYEEMRKVNPGIILCLAYPVWREAVEVQQQALL